MNTDREEIIKLAREAGFETKRAEVYVEQWTVTRTLERFAHLVAEYERENCALLCESLDPYVYSERTANHCAEVIRKQIHHQKNKVMDLVESMNTMAQNLTTRAQIRDQITTRKSVMEGVPDRLSQQLREASSLLTQGAEELSRRCN